MKFSVTEITAKPGEKLSVTLVNIGTTPKFSMGHNWLLLATGVDIQPFLVASAEAVTTDYVPRATQRRQDPRRHQAARPEGARHGHVHRADHSRPLRLHLLVPRALPGRHAWRADRAVTFIPSKDISDVYAPHSPRRRQSRRRPHGDRWLQPSGQHQGRQQRHLRGREVVRRARAEGRVLPVLLGRALGPGLRRRPPVDAAHLDDSRLRALPGHRLRLRRGIAGR